MQRSRRFLFCAAVLTCLCAVAPERQAAAQGLIWQLPKDENFSVLYEGTYTQKDAPDADGVEKQPIVWTRHLMVKSLGREKGIYRGREVGCRWIELIVRTGEYDSNRQGDPIDTGPAGKRVYRVLIPESRIIGDTQDAQTIFVSLLPIAETADGKIQGVKKIGQSDPVRMKVPVLQVYPILSLLHHYRTLTPATGTSTFTIEERRAPQTQYAKRTLTTDEYQQYTAERHVESRTRRATNNAVLFRSAEVPTGLLSWEVTVLHEGKDAGQGRDEFQTITEITTKLKVTKISYGDAQSELPHPKTLP